MNADRLQRVVLKPKTIFGSRPTYQVRLGGSIDTEEVLFRSSLLAEVSMLVETDRQVDTPYYYRIRVIISSSELPFVHFQEQFTEHRFLPKHLPLFSGLRLRNLDTERPALTVLIATVTVRCNSRIPP